MTFFGRIESTPLRVTMWPDITLALHRHSTPLKLTTVVWIVQSEK